MYNPIYEHKCQNCFLSPPPLLTLLPPMTPSFPSKCQSCTSTGEDIAPKCHSGTANPLAQHVIYTEEDSSRHPIHLVKNV